MIKGDSRSHCRDRGKVLQHDGVSSLNTDLENGAASKNLYNYLTTSIAFLDVLTPVWRVGPH